MPRSELFDVAAEKRGETDKALRLFDGKTTEWVPKSQVLSVELANEASATSQ